MRMSISDAEGRVLHGLLEETSGDIVVRVDEAGFILHASESAAEIGLDPASLLVMPQVADLAGAGYARAVARYVKQVFADNSHNGWIEFPIRDCKIEDAANCDCATPTCLRWYALSLKRTERQDGQAPVALGLLRSVQQRHSLLTEIGTNAARDALTGLANRQFICAAIERELARDGDQALAVFAIDGLRAVFMQYGQSTIEEIQWGFARFLESMALPVQQVGQLDDERFAVLLPGLTMRQAREWARDVLRTFAGLAADTPTRAPELTASAGVSRLEITVDWTLRQAELGLVMARAGGGMQVGVCGYPDRTHGHAPAIPRIQGRAQSGRS